jgi:histidyl-tRNA synthetase
MRDLRPHAFVIAAKDEVADELPKLVAELRRSGHHVRHTYRSTRNVGKLLGEAGKCGARTAIILDDKLAEGLVSIKDLASGEQRDNVKRDEIEQTLRDILAQQHDVDC